MVFETGLPTQHYFGRTAVDLSLLTPSDTVTECPYKGRPTAYRWPTSLDEPHHVAAC